MTKQPNKPKRKRYSDEFKAYLVQEAENTGSSIASIARDNGINQNLLHNWKYQHKKAQIVSPAAHCSTEQPPQFIPIILGQTEPTPPNDAEPPSPPPFEQTNLTAIINDIQLQIPTHNTMPIKLTIDQIDTHSLLELLRGLQ